MGNNSSNNNKTTLRKSQSVPDTQKLSPDAPVFSKEKSMSQQRLNVKQGKPNKAGVKKHKHEQEELPQLPPAEAAFLPDFPLRGDLEELEFEVIDVIAKGAFGNVIKVQREDQKRFYAMKVLDKEQIIQEGAIKQCKDEAAIQSVAGDHPFIVKAYEYWQSRRFLYILLDYVPHGDMFTLWTFHGAFPENLVRLYIAEISLVIDYLHNASVIYRDVKMENILFDPKGHIQMTDFGLAKWLQGGDKTRTVCGTLQYMAPEVLSVYPYDHTADWWSVGILMYAMLAGKYPVDGADTHTKMAQRVFECDYLLPSHISDSAQDVINRFLTKSPHKRLSDLYTIQDLHFFQDIVFSDLIDRKVSPIEIVPEDFFPMTGESWAPNVITPEEQRHFDQFDDSSETITQDEGYQHLPHYQRSHHHHSITYRPQSLDRPQGSEAKSHLPDSYRKPSLSQPISLSQAMEAKSSHQDPAPPPTSYSKKISVNRDQDDSSYIRQTSVPFSHHHSTGNIASNVNSGLYSVSGSSNSWRDRPVQSSSGYDSEDNVGATYNTTASGGGSGNFFRQNSEASDRFGGSQNYCDVSNLPGASGTLHNNTNGVDAKTGVPGLGQAMVSHQTLTRRSISGDGLVSSSNNPTNNFTSTTVNPSPSLTYKTVEPPPTVTLRSPGFNTAPPGYGRQMSGYNPTNSSLTLTISANPSQTYNSASQVSQSDHTTGPYHTRRSNVQNSGAYNTSQGYITVDAPPVITLPQQNNFNSYKPETPTGTLGTNTSKNGFSHPYTSVNNGPNNPYTSSNNYTRLEQQSTSLNTIPQVSSEKPVVTMKPVPPQKPAKPLAPIRPQPAPRRSLMGQASNSHPQTTPTGMNSPTLTSSKPVSSPGFQSTSAIVQGSQNKPGFVQAKPNFSQGIQSSADHMKSIQNNNNLPQSTSNNSSQRFHENAYPASASLNTSISNSASFQPYQAQAIFPPQSLSLSQTSSDHTRSRLGSNAGQETHLKSPGSDSLKWNLPADATPSFV